MKRIVFLLVLLLSVTVFAEKLTTDGKTNLDKLKGNWENSRISIQTKNNKWFFGVYDNDETGDYIWKEIKVYKNGALYISNFHSKEVKNKDRNFYFAYDTKYKTLVELDKELNITHRIPKNLNKPVN